MKANKTARITLEEKGGMERGRKKKQGRKEKRWKERKAGWKKKKSKEGGKRFEVSVLMMAALLTGVHAACTL